MIAHNETCSSAATAGGSWTSDNNWRAKIARPMGPIRHLVYQAVICGRVGERVAANGMATGEVVHENGRCVTRGPLAAGLSSLSARQVAGYGS